MMWRILCLTPDNAVKTELDSLANARPEHFSIDHVTTIDEAIGSTSATNYNAYVLDCSFDWPKPLSLCNLIRSWDSDCLIIIMSLEESDRKDVIEAGASLFLRRPSDVRKLRQTIEVSIK